MESFTIEDKKLTDIIKCIGDRMKDPNQVRYIATSDKNQVKIEGKLHQLWHDTSLSHGYPGICLLFGEMSEHFQDENWDQVAHEYMIKIQQAIAEQGIHTLSLFGGLSGIGMASLALSKNGTRYRKFLSQINKWLMETLPVHLKSLKEKQSRLAMGDYDVIQGLSGIGRYLLFFKDVPEMNNLLTNILKYMVDLTRDVEVLGQWIPGWYISVENQFLESDKRLYPKGNFNCGLAHGIPGPLALLSLALLKGVEVEGHQRAMKKISKWLVERKCWNQYGVFWPGRISFEDYVAGTMTEQGTREAWCYGSPGVLRSLWLAGTALNHKDYQELSIAALDRIFDEPEENWGLYSPTFCHGFAGLLHITQLMYLDTGHIRFKDYRDRVLRKIMEMYDPSAAFGFYNIDSQDPVNTGEMTKMNNPGLLDGITGTALAILAAARPVKTNWDAVFLIN